MTKLFRSVGTQCLNHFKFNIKATSLWFYIAFSAGLYTIQYLYFYQHSFTQLNDIFLFDVIFSPANIFMLFAFSRSNNIKTWLLFIIFSKMLSLATAIIGHDIATVGSFNIATSSEEFFVIISDVTIFGTVIVQVLLIPYMLSAAIFNYIDYLFVSKNRSALAKNVWWLFLLIIEVGTYYVAFQYLIFDYFERESEAIYLQSISDSAIDYKDYLSNLFDMVRPLIAFAWFPLMFFINNVRDTDIFFSKNQEIYVGSQIVFLIKYIEMYYQHKHMYMPIIIISFISFKMLLFLLYSAKTLYFNSKELNYMKPHLYKISRRKKENKFIELLVATL